MFYVDFFLQAYPFTIGLLLLLAALQVLFCYKVKRFWISILPSVLFALLFTAVGIPCMVLVLDAFAPLIVAFPVILLIQLLLCFKVKRVALRLIPTILLPLISVAFLVMTLTTSGWDFLGYLFFMLYTAFAWVIDGVAWGIWAMVRHIRTDRGRGDDIGEHNE